MAAPTFTLSPGSATPPSNPLGLEGIDHFQLAGPLEALEGIYRRLGFARVASGEGSWGRMACLRQNRITLLVLDADGGHAAGRYHQDHGAGVCALAFRVADLDAALGEARRRGAQVRQEAQRHDLGGAVVSFAAIQGVGDVLNVLVERQGDPEGFWPGLVPDPAPALCEPGLVRVDHLTNNVGPGEMDDLVAFYERVYGFTVTRTFRIQGNLGTGLRSSVVQSSDGRIIIPINEPTDLRSQIQEFVDRHKGQGVQHIALSTNDIETTLRVLMAQGLRFLRVPDTYYELLPGRIDAGGYQVRESLEMVRDLGLQIDGDASGYLLQIFTEDQIGPLFFEIIQRRGNRGFGEGNFQALYDSIEMDQKRRGVL